MFPYSITPVVQRTSLPRLESTTSGFSTRGAVVQVIMYTNESSNVVYRFKCDSLNPARPLSTWCALRTVQCCIFKVISTDLASSRYLRRDLKERYAFYTYLSTPVGPLYHGCTAVASLYSSFIFIAICCWRGNWRPRLFLKHMTIVLGIKSALSCTNEV